MLGNDYGGKNRKHLRRLSGMSKMEILPWGALACFRGRL